MGSAAIQLARLLRISCAVASHSHSWEAKASGWVHGQAALLDFTAEDRTQRDHGVMNRARGVPLPHQLLYEMLNVTAAKFRQAFGSKLGQDAVSEIDVIGTCDLRTYGSGSRGFAWRNVQWRLHAARGC